MGELIFEPEKHEYFHNGILIPGCTEVIKESGLMGHFSDQYYMDRGNAVHRATHYLDEDDLDWSTLAPEQKPLNST